MYCSKCGNQIQDGEQYCSNCGSKVILDKTDIFYNN
ncbi:MAG: zinc-ribbon domain-containing protein, partial [Candidatus Izemoplasmatales bacterium]